MEGVCKAHFITGFTARYQPTTNRTSRAFGIKNLTCAITVLKVSFYKMRENSKQAPMQKAFSTKLLFVILSVTLFTWKRDVTETVLYGIVCFVCGLFFFMYIDLVRALEKCFFFKYLQYFYCTQQKGSNTFT